MYIEDRDQVDSPTIQGKRSPTNLEARMEEARALRRSVLAQREKGIDKTQEDSYPSNGFAPTFAKADDEPDVANTAISESQPQFHEPTAPEAPAEDDMEKRRVYPPQPRVGRVAERLALGLGIGLGLGASLYLGASLSGARIGFVTSDAPAVAEQSQQAAMSLETVVTSEIVSPDSISVAEPVSLSINNSKDAEQAAVSSHPAPSEVAVPTYEMAMEAESPVDAQQTQQSLDLPLTPPAINASFESGEPVDAPAILPEFLDVIPSEALEPQLEVALIPDDEFVNELSAGPTATIRTEEDFSDELAEETILPLVEPDLSVPGADAYTIVLSVPNSLSDDEIESVTKGIVETGASIAKVDRVSFRVSATQIRFFRAEDAEPAAAIAKRVGAEPRDFTSYQPSPPVGTIEMFLAGGGGRSGSSQKSRLKQEETVQKKRTVKRYPTNDNR